MICLYYYQVMARLHGVASPVADVGVHDGMGRIVAACSAKTVHVWDAATFQVRRITTGATVTRLHAPCTSYHFVSITFLSHL